MSLPSLSCSSMITSGFPAGTVTSYLWECVLCRWVLISVIVWQTVRLPLCDKHTHTHWVCFLTRDTQGSLALSHTLRTRPFFFFFYVFIIVYHASAPRGECSARDGRRRLAEKKNRGDGERGRRCVVGGVCWMWKGQRSRVFFEWAQRGLCSRKESPSRLSLVYLLVCLLPLRLCFISLNSLSPAFLSVSLLHLLTSLS